ncbi:MAG: hypothetical protein AUJ52_12475 [Elusimicrobia bacterium CG1_02_63_36]|nr:MAG: hypothetical protein AUJ52_12475 [Elusimicrobia bacterium CG1_02_63_36]PIP83009.1 MAG: acylneuraminate cytidylyltransferase [Elusimicrobia bacterium CG22_combo_CG10-13_8_21_14_all_63_91]PJA17502.1 MAG: acylneuraminate cytidylyltransferase family protein [Elusimicrobia bacterium CG_4_10_14_0_2_um_filter_63_34]PJB25426.1 MAG: acylneuraminate cytidylyltransferase family protein [Elusimicrobia bacterium CG_4_9_14_3_um_filter_62_55]
MNVARPTTVAVIPARGKSRGLPDKNLRKLAGLPLIAHSILLARSLPEIDACVVSTDSPNIRETAEDFGASVFGLRPAELAGDETPMWPVLRHALETTCEALKRSFDFLLLLDPTSPTRSPEQVTKALKRLAGSPEADGIVSVSQPDFNPVWHGVLEKNGWMEDLDDRAVGIQRRQDAPRILRINGLLYAWRTRFVRESPSWRGAGRHLAFETPESQAVSIDTPEQFARTDALIRGGFLKLPWLEERR